MGVADPSSGAPILAVASLAAAVQHITMECFSESGAPAISQMTLLPGQSSMATACPRQGEDAGDADPLLAESSARPHGPLGIRLTSDGAPGAFSAFALAPHADGGSRSFSSVLFNDPQAARSSDIVFVGVAVGSASLLPSGAYTPHISLANFSTAPLHVHIQFAHTSSGDTAAPQEVSTVTIDPGVSREVTLADLRGDPDMQNSFIVAPDGAPGVLAAKFVAQGEGPLLRRLELQAKDEGSRQNAGGHPWSLEDGTESTLLLFNHGNKSQHFTVAISGSESWQKTYTMAAMETKAVSLRDLVESRTTDDSGRTLSPDVQSGEASWFVPDSTQSTGRLLQFSRATGMARNYSCGFENLLCGSSVSIYQSTFPDGSVADFADITGITCTSGSYTACSGAQTGTGGYYNTRWSAGSPNIAPTSGSNTNSNVNLLGAAAGSSFTTGLIQSSYCSSAGGGTAVVLPTPRIFYNGNDVTSQTLSGLVGVQIPLTASITLPTGVTASNPTWTISDAAVGSYSVSQTNASYTPVVKNPSSTTFYWTKGGSQTVTHLVTLSTGLSTSANVTFNVIVPTVTATGKLTSPVSIVPNIPYPDLTLGAEHLDGITFNVSLGSNAGIPASYSSVQLLTSGSYKYRCPGGKLKSRALTTGLDTTYPYYKTVNGGFGSLTVQDSPLTSLNTELTEVQEAESFTMYLMFNAGPSSPSSTPTIPISLGYFTWSWSGDAVQNTSNQTWSLSTSPSPSSSVSPFAPGGVLPTWGPNVASLGGLTCP